MFPHDLKNEMLFRDIADLVSCFDGQIRDAVEVGLGGVDDAPAFDVLSQYHREKRRRPGIIKTFIGKLEPRVLRMSRQQQGAAAAMR